MYQTKSIAVNRFEEDNLAYFKVVYILHSRIFSFFLKVRSKGSFELQRNVYSQPSGEFFSPPPTFQRLLSNGLIKVYRYIFVKNSIERLLIVGKGIYSSDLS